MIEHSFRDSLDRMILSYEYGEKFEWDKWRYEIPFISFKEHWCVQMTPPFRGVIVRFFIRNKNFPERAASVFLDCYSVLSCMKNPYWEIFGFNGEQDAFRFDMNDVDGLMKKMEEILDGDSK